MPVRYLLELRYSDGRIESRPSGEFSGWSPLEVGAWVEIDGEQWRIRGVAPESGYDAKVMLDED
jgi:hypothetical protein